MDEDRLKDIIKDAISELRSEEKTRKLKEYSDKDSVLGKTIKSRRREPGRGIVESKETDEVLLHCGHHEKIGVGYKADCGHKICRECFEVHYLVCAEPGCFRSFCTVAKCRNKPQMFSGLPFCMKHKLLFMNMYYACGILSRKKAENMLESYKRDYESKRSRISKVHMKKMKDEEKPDDEEDISRRSDRA